MCLSYVAYFCSRVITQKENTKVIPLGANLLGNVDCSISPLKSDYLPHVGAFSWSEKIIEFPNSSGVAKLGHTGARAPVTGGRAPPTAGALANYRRRKCRCRPWSGANLAVQIAICILRNRVQWDQGRVRDLLLLYEVSYASLISLHASLPWVMKRLYTTHKSGIVGMLLIQGNGMAWNSLRTYLVSSKIPNFSGGASPHTPQVCSFVLRWNSHKRTVPMLCPSIGCMLATPLPNSIALYQLHIWLSFIPLCMHK